MQLIRCLGLQGLLSFPPDVEPFVLQPLNVLIGPNGAGKTNLIEALEILRATPTDFAAALRAGGHGDEWLWRGAGESSTSKISVDMEDGRNSRRLLRYSLEFDIPFVAEIVDEKIEKINPPLNRKKKYFYYDFNAGKPLIRMKKLSERGNVRSPLQELDTENLNMDRSVLSQVKGRPLYPEIHIFYHYFSRINTFREWTFGSQSDIRRPQRTDDPPDEFLSNSRNLALVLNEIQHRDNQVLNEAMRRFMPRYERISTRIFGNTIQLYLHERGLKDPIPTTRISDGTLRFLAMLAALLAPTPPSLLCLEEPELGMHPDAVALLAELLVEASSRMQLIVTTHSDALLSALNDKMESVLVCENDGHGTTIERLDAERLAFWLKNYTLGDIWRIGEIGGNP